jgi:segregation and condensation protein A
VIADASQSPLFADEHQIAYTVKTEAFEGPMDLLLHLIKKNEVDIYNIPIAEITRQYLAYLDVMRELNLDVAGDFLVMASTLVQIKSKMLLPVAADEEAEDESGEDPRTELVRRLLEYQKYKEAAVALASRELLDRDIFARTFESPELADLPAEDAPLELDLVELVNAFRRVLEKAPQESFHEVGSENISIADRISDILEFLQGKELVVFEDLFQGSLTREYLVATFLAILELCRLKLIKLTQVESFGQIWIKPAVVPQDDEQFTEETVDSYRT